MNRKPEHVRKDQKQMLLLARSVKSMLGELLGLMLSFHRQMVKFCDALEEAQSEQGTEKGS